MSRLHTPLALVHIKSRCCRACSNILRCWLLLEKISGGARHPTTVYHRGVAIRRWTVIILHHTWHALIIVVACTSLHIGHSPVIRKCLSRWLLLLLTEAKHCHLLLYLVNLEWENLSSVYTIIFYMNTKIERTSVIRHRPKTTVKTKNYCYDYHKIIIVLENYQMICLSFCQLWRHKKVT